MKEFLIPLCDGLITITSWSIDGQMSEADLAPASGAWSVANLAYYQPFRLARPFCARTMFVLNGAVVAGNVDVGIYDEGFRRRVSIGGVAQAGVNTNQVFNIADSWIGPGIFYLAMVCDDVTATCFRGMVSDEQCQLMGICSEANAYPLPALANPASPPPAGRQWCVGVSSRTVP